MRFLVTGGAGFIGSHLCERLLNLKHHVICVDNFNDFYCSKIKRSNIYPLLNQNFTLFDYDFRKFQIPENVDCVIHLAAYAGVRPSIQDPLLYSDVNVSGTIKLLNDCAETGIKKFIFASSSSVYGNNKKTPFSETDNVDFPISPYAATKKAGELLCYTYHKLYDMDITCLRFFTVYGQRQRPDLAIRKFFTAIKKEEPIHMFGDGLSGRDYTFIDDIIDGIIASIEKCKGYNIYNLGNSNPVILRDLIEKCFKISGSNVEVIKEPMQPGDVEITYADIEKAKNELCFNPKTPIDDGLSRMWEWMNV